MYSHIMVGSNDLDKSTGFYDAVLGTVGSAPAMDGGDRKFWMTETGIFAVTKPIDGKAATTANGATIGFACATTEQVDKFHAAGVAAGGTSIEDPPGWRETDFGPLYLCYLRDPDGNKLCGFHKKA